MIIGEKNKIMQFMGCFANISKIGNPRYRIGGTRLGMVIATGNPPRRRWNLIFQGFVTIFFRMHIIYIKEILSQEMDQDLCIELCLYLQATWRIKLLKLCMDLILINCNMKLKKNSTISKLVKVISCVHAWDLPRNKFLHLYS